MNFNKIYEDADAVRVADCGRSAEWIICNYFKRKIFVRERDSESRKIILDGRTKRKCVFF